MSFVEIWCCERGLNSRPLPYQGSALPLSYRSAEDAPLLPHGAGPCKRFGRRRLAVRNSVCSGRSALPPRTGTFSFCPGWATKLPCQPGASSTTAEKMRLRPKKTVFHGSRKRCVPICACARTGLATTRRQAEMPACCAAKDRSRRVRNLTKASSNAGPPAKGIKAIGSSNG